MKATPKLRLIHLFTPADEITAFFSEPLYYAGGKPLAPPICRFYLTRDRYVWPTAGQNSRRNVAAGGFLVQKCLKELDLRGIG
jgi:hypothetical protein